MASRSRFYLAARLALGGIFIAASLGKIVDPRAFAEMVYNYQLLPDEAVNLAALLLPWVELLLGLLLIVGRALPGAVFLSNLLLLAFFGALMFNLARGLNIHCGCFSTDPSGDPATWWYIIRDTGFLVLGGYLFLKTFTGKTLTAPRKY
ncbi:MAG: DoxX family membrane protein [Deltaproteobacteria bacterium]|nr:DoxX family membrane protein [Deltaproteobacteria bacterium]